MNAPQLKHDRYRDLLDMVADIAMMSDSARLANHVAEQARRLLHADVVYLWLSAPSGDHIRLGATAGGLTSELRDIRIPAGRAMAGKIIESGLPLVVSDYSSDATFTHHPELDQLMASERIIAAAGVPLAPGLDTIGALIAASRIEREYSLDDVELLRVLGVHAGISLERATLLEEKTQALAAAVRDNDALAQQNSSAAQLHATFARVALTGGQISELANEMVKIIGGQLAVFDEDGRMLAEAGGFVATDRAEEVVSAATVSRTTQTGDGYAAVPIVTAVGLHGVLCHGAAGGPKLSDVQAVERAAVTAALLLLRVEAESRAAGFRRDDFLNDLVQGDDTPASLVHRAAQMKFDLRQPYTVHVVRAGLQERRIGHLAYEAARTRNGLAGRCRAGHADERSAVVVLLPGDDAHSACTDLAETMKRAAREPVSVAGAGPARTALDAQVCFKEARACSDAMLRIGAYNLSGTMADLGFLGLVLGRDQSIQLFIDAQLGPVIAYDADHHTELLRTLDALLATDGGPTAASKTLHVHVSTVKQRMQRLQALLGDDWRSVSRSFELRLAIMLERIRPE